MFLCDQPLAPPRRAAVKTIRLRDKEHCKYVATQACLICGRTPSEAHHIRFAQPRALGEKVSDKIYGSSLSAASPRTAPLW
jgi:hypothetical protein